MRVSLLFGIFDVWPRSRWPKFAALLCSLWVVAVIVARDSALAATTDAGHLMSATEKRQHIEAILAVLDDPNPVTRLLGVDRALKERDRDVRRFTLAHAFASSDEQVRASALAGAIATSATFVLDFGMGPASQANTAYKATSGSFDVHILRFNRDNGTFLTYSAYSDRDNDRLDARPSAVAGDRISFEVDMSRTGYRYSCVGVARLESGSSRLKGTMHCYNDNYNVTIEILR